MKIQNENKLDIKDVASLQKEKKEIKNDLWYQALMLGLKVGIAVPIIGGLTSLCSGVLAANLGVTLLVTPVLIPVVGFTSLVGVSMFLESFSEIKQDIEILLENNKEIKETVEKIESNDNLSTEMYWSQNDNERIKVTEEERYNEKINKIEIKENGVLVDCFTVRRVPSEKPSNQNLIEEYYQKKQEILDYLNSEKENRNKQKILELKK